MYQERGAKIVAAHPDKDIVIVRQGEIHVFDRNSEMVAFVEELSPLDRASLFMVPRGRPGLKTGYRRVITP